MSITIDNNTKAGYYDSIKGKVHTGERMKVGVNSSFPRYWARSLPWRNIVKHASISVGTASPGTIDTDGYVDASTSGTWSVNMAEKLPTGSYVLTYTDTSGGVTGSVGFAQGSLDTESDDGTNYRKEYSFTAQSGLQILSVVGKISNLAFFLAADETGYLAGEVLSSQYIADMGSMAIYRSMDNQPTNNSPVRDYADFIPLSHISWARDLREGRNLDGHNHPSLLPKIANELDVDLWMHIPAQATDACVTSMMGDVESGLDAGRTIYLEHSNEVWNSATAFADGFWWTNYLEVTAQDTESYDPATSIAVDTAHGLTWADAIWLFNSILQQDWPFAGGNRTWAMVDDVDTFRVALWYGTITSITLANPGVVRMVGQATPSNKNDLGQGTTVGEGAIVEFGNMATGMVELDGNSYTATNVVVTGSGSDGATTYTEFELYTDDVTPVAVDTSAFTAHDGSGEVMQDAADHALYGLPPARIAEDTTQSLRYKNASLGLGNGHSVNYTTRCLEVWDLAESALATHTLKRVGATQMGNSTAGGAFRTTSFINASPEWQAKIDYICPATYYSAGDFTTMNNTQLLQAYIDWFDSELRPRIQNHIRAVGHTRIIAYEGGPSVEGTANQTEKYSWVTSAEHGQAIDYFMEHMAEEGVQIHMHYNAHSSWVGISGGDYWGSMEWPGDNTKVKWLTYEAIAAAGGASKP